MHCAAVVIFLVHINMCLWCCLVYFSLSICHCWWCTLSYEKNCCCSSISILFHDTLPLNHCFMIQWNCDLRISILSFKWNWISLILKFFWKVKFISHHITLFYTNTSQFCLAHAFQVKLD
jgi:hypothetical protein